MAAAVADDEQRVASASEEEINRILVAGTVKTPKMLSRQHRIYRKSVSRRLNSRMKIGGKNVRWHDENMHRFEKLLLTVLVVWLEEEPGLICQKNQ